MTSILLVDDHPSLLEIMAIALEDHYTIYTACDGREGVQKSLQENPDLMIADYAMPEMNGLEMIEQIFAQTAKRPLVLLVSAYLSSEVKQRAKELGVVECIAKPFDIVYLRGRIERILKKHQPAVPEKVESPSD